MTGPGCGFWLHPNHRHGFVTATDRELALGRRLEIGRQSGVPEAVLQRYAERSRGMASGIARVIEPDRPLVDGVEIETDLGTWRVFETPGHAPSHVCLFQAERRLLISGDHLLGRISLYFDYGWTHDPIGEFVRSLDVTDELGARLALSGHGKPFIDVHGHVEANRKLVRERLDAVLAAVAHEPKTAVEIVPSVYGEELTETNTGWRLQETLCYLNHLELQGRVSRESEGDLAAWEGISNSNLDTTLSRLVSCRTMRIDHILATADEPVFSFEFFPPKTDEGERTLRADPRGAEATLRPTSCR